MKDEFLDVSGFWTIRFAAGAVQALPARWALGAGRFLGACGYFFSGRKHSAYADLKAAFGKSLTPEQRWKVVRGHYEHIGQSALEFLRFPLLNLDTVRQDVDIHHLERFHEAVNQGKGVLLLTAHLGNWELLQMVSGVLGKPIHALMREQKHSRLNSLLNDFRQIKGSRVVRNRGMDLRDLVRALRRSELVGVLADQSAGKSAGLILPFFGRKTTIPTGAFEIASRTGSIILPAFISRGKDGRHVIHVEEIIPCPLNEKDEAKFEEPVRRYLELVEKRISENPEQWLWAKKRWKYSWTKRLVVLSDGKPGHVKQSQAIVQSFRSVETQYGRPGMEYRVETIPVGFKSEAHRILFQILAFFFIPWAQGRLSWLRFFLNPETAAAVENSGADFVISTGASLVPLNLCLARENGGKSIVLMKPPFPYSLCRYDLAVVPEHDTGRVPEQAIRTLLTPSAPSSEFSGDLQNVLRDEVKKPEKVGVSVFLGGATRRYGMPLGNVKQLFEVLEKNSAAAGDYLVTTSRRTPAEVCNFLKIEKPRFLKCQSLVLASEDPRSGVVESMMQLASILIVTEDSISMVSEAVSSGKRVVVLGLGETAQLPAKHQRFLKLLEERGAVVRASVMDLEEKIKNANAAAAPSLAEQEKKALREKLQEIL